MKMEVVHKYGATAVQSQALLRSSTAPMMSLIWLGEALKIELGTPGCGACSACKR